MKLMNTYAVAACLALTTLSFQNCTQANFSSDGTAQNLGGDDGGDDNGAGLGENAGGGGAGVIPTESEAEQNCMNRSLILKNLAITFPKPPLCDWNKNGNLNQRNGWVQARGEQSVKLDVPANAVICKMTFDFPTQNTIYDDQIILTLNDYVITSSQKELVNRFPKDRDLYRYDWGAIKGQEIDVGGFNPYIAGEELGLASVSMPATQTSGQFKIQMSEEVFYKFAAVKPAGQQHQFGFITTGDNDDGIDCQHEPIKFSVRATYYIP